MTTSSSVNSLTTFSFNNNPISFDFGDNLKMINATQMAKPFAKTPKDWLRTQSSKEFIAAISKARQISLALLCTKQNGVGTWMQEDIALEFARWLNPVFAIWCNDRIKELLTTGFTSLQSLSPAELLLKQVQMMVDAEKERNEMKEDIKYLKAKTNASDVDYFSIKGYGSLNGYKIDLKLAASLGRKATRLCSQMGYVTGIMPDPRFGKVKTYPTEVLDSVFKDLN